MYNLCCDTFESFKNEQLCDETRTRHKIKAVIVALKTSSKVYWKLQYSKVYWKYIAIWHLEFLENIR